MNRVPPRRWQVWLLWLLVPAITLWIHAGATPSTGRLAATPPRMAAQAERAAAFETIELDWRDPARDRQVPALLFWPHGDANRTRPLIVFSHGLGSARDGYSYLGRYWASQGIASLHVQHVGSDRTLWEGDPLELTARFRRAASDREAVARVNDVRFALDQLLAGPHGASIDRGRIAIGGHSYGANTAMLLAGARVPRAGKIVDLHDPRFAAAILISAPPIYGEADLRPILSGIHIPTLHITTRDDVIVVPGFESGPADRRRVFDATGGFKVMAIYKQGSHNVFTERRYFDSVAVATEAKAATESLSMAFLEEVFAQHERLGQWADLHPALLADYVVRR